MRKIRETTNNKTFSDFLEKQTDMPPVSLSDIPYIEISGRKHIELDGVHKILEYSNEKIKIRFRKVSVSFNGEGLFISNFSGKTAIIEGKLETVVFEN